MNRRLVELQAFLLAAGAAFSWFTLALDFRRYFDAGGRILEFSECAAGNPLATPCFYGAIAFLAAFAWSVAVLRSDFPAARARQRGLRWLLLAGTLFAWGSFGLETWRRLRPPAVPAPSALGCPPAVDAPANPLAAPCFYGALIFLASLLVSGALLRERRRLGSSRRP